MRNHRNIKVRMILVCIMQKDESVDGGKKFINIGSKVYFNTETYINLDSTDVKVILSQMIREFWKKLVFFEWVARVGISKKYPVLKFILSITNQLKAQVIFHFQIL